MEKWEIIEEAPNYLISNLGRVQNRTTGRILKTPLSAQGYPRVGLTVGEEHLQRSVHRLVAIAFVDGREPGLVVNHIDGNKLNFLPENLEWITREENMEHAKRTGLKRKLRKWLVKDDGSLEEIE